MKFFSISLVIACISSSISFAQDTIYFDKDWKETKRQNHSFFRLMPLKKVGELVYLTDYYKGGKLQFQGYVSSKDEHEYYGDISWYNLDGTIQGSYQYLNKSSAKELIYENLIGELWQKITYQKNGEKSKIITYFNDKEISIGTINGSKYSGSFVNNLPESYYRSNSEMEEKRPSMVMSMPIKKTENNQNKVKRDSYLIIIFWKNGQKASESKYEYYDEYSNHLVEQSFWDKKGKLINVLESFGNDITTNSGKKYTYYLENGFATGIKTEEIFDINNNQKNVLKEFDQKGNLISEEKYTDDSFKEIKEFKNGKTLIKKYKEGDPFDGNFTDDVGRFIVNYSMKNGMKEGKSSILKKEDNSLIGEGFYKNNEPFDGKIYSKNYNGYALFEYKNGKQDGVQIIYENYNLDSYKEVFEMKAGERNGYRKQYDDGKLVNEVLYKNGEGYEGTINEGNEITTYKDGEITNKKMLSKDYNSKVAVNEDYINGIISSKEYFNFDIVNVNQNSYKGIYKDGKPYSGYFQEQFIIDKIPLINYYENGLLKYQYSFEILKQLENYNRYIYNIKSTYQDGKIYNGSEYFAPDKNGFIRAERKNNEIETIDINVFAMHYFNRITIQKNENEYGVNDLQSKLNLKIKERNNELISEFYEGKVLVKTSEPNIETSDGTPNSITMYYLDKNELKTYSFKAPNLENVEYSDSGMFLEMIYSFFPKKNTTNLMNDFLNMFQNSLNENSFDKVVSSNYFSQFPFTEESFISDLRYDNNGKPYDGIRITKVNNEYKIEGFDSGKLKRNLKVKSIEETIKNDPKYIINMVNEMINED